MYSKKLHSIIGFHACDAVNCCEMLNGKQPLRKSESLHDWLGHGMYFFEDSYHRAKEWADASAKRGKFKDPAVIGAAIDLGHCLDFLDSKYLSLLKPAYERLVSAVEKGALKKLPENRSPSGSDEILLRSLDCAVIELIHKDMKDSGQPVFDTVRGVFWEGTEPYPNCGFKEKDHIQVCVRNPNCIKGYFLPRDPDKGWPLP